MSTPHIRPASPDALIEPTDCHTAHFATRWLQPSLAVIAAHGELDAANAQEFVDYSLRHAAHIDHLVLDLSGVDFFGTAGFSALHTLNVRCAAEKIEWDTCICEMPTRSAICVCVNDSKNRSSSTCRSRSGRAASKGRNASRFSI